MQALKQILLNQEHRDILFAVLGGMCFFGGLVVLGAAISGFPENRNFAIAAAIIGLLLIVAFFKLSI